MGYEKNKENINEILLAKIDLNEDAYQQESFSIAKSKSINVHEAIIKIKNVLKENNIIIRSETTKAIVTEWKKITINGEEEETRLRINSDANKNIIEFHIDKRYKTKEDKIIQSKNYYKEIFDKINESLKE